jgi:hypothetical protein
MSSAAQVLANRENSLRSTGPVTAAGKAASSRNSFRHGLTSKQIVLPGEDPAEYDALRQSVLDQYQPVNETECLLVEELAAGHWRLMRARRHETAILAKLLADAPDPDAAYATLFLEKPKEMDRLLRYITSIERAFYRALNKLEKLQKERAINEHRAALEEAWLARTSQPVNPDSEIGFVSQSPQSPRETEPPTTEPRPQGSGLASTSNANKNRTPL